jgi:hypothetical protein
LVTALGFILARSLVLITLWRDDRRTSPRSDDEALSIRFVRSE